MPTPAEPAEAKTKELEEKVKELQRENKQLTRHAKNDKFMVTS